MVDIDGHSKFYRRYEITVLKLSLGHNNVQVVGSVRMKTLSNMYIFLKINPNRCCKYMT